MENIEYIPWSKAIKLCYKLAEKILDSKYVPDTIIAVLRGGAIPALIISDYLGVEEFYGMRVKHWGIASKKLDKPVILQMPENLKHKKLLIVDEVADTGLTLKTIIEELKKQKPQDIKTAVLHVKPTTKYMPDYYVEYLKEWRWIFYPWSVSETLSSLARRGSSIRDLDKIYDKVRELARSFNIVEPDIKVILKSIKTYIEKYKNI
ncbi:phosphoribosyltransferase [Staphylothermus hellenicus]|uniref:Phosphoribosyltransferase n=1 Tax=Staphylothermus hellenicus (strain DSM 12710 / JCM 10830 / BK20S6-10-b1 / P8) TaxID=591019 RepID=D7DAI7_STAHD|nr:phosphoribosyltransferase [Staphylothermus hellenicus]ADI31184.1 phosphoribosyltransferase [Staphylothermus hellenicus DSM 12710]